MTAIRQRSLSTELRDDLFIEERQLRVADMYLVKQMTQIEIAKALGISQATVSNDIQKIRAEYSMKRLNKLQMYLNTELLKLDAVEKEAWRAWERSIGQSKRVVKRTDPDGNIIETVETEDTLVGDPRFLTQVQTAIDRRIKLLGLDAPQEILLNTMEGKLSRLIHEGKVTFDMLANDIGIEQAVRYFNMAGVEVPDIIEGDYE